MPTVRKKNNSEFIIIGDVKIQQLLSQTFKRKGIIGKYSGINRPGISRNTKLREWKIKNVHNKIMLITDEPLMLRANCTKVSSKNKIALL